MLSDLESASRKTGRVLTTEPQPEAADRLDRWIRTLARQEARCRLVLGELAAVFLRRGCSRRLGFARLGDWTRERLGISPRELEEAARVARRLRDLPELRAAFEGGELCWSQVREVLAVATVDDESTWISVARGRPVREVKRLVAEARRNLPDRPPDEDDEEHVDGEPRATFRMACPRRIRVLWRRGVELARAMAGEEYPVWKAAETIAAEASTGAEADVHDCDVSEGAMTVARAPAVDSGEVPSGWETLEAAIPADIEGLLLQCESRDTFELDRRMIRCVREMRGASSGFSST